MICRVLAIASTTSNNKTSRRKKHVLDDAKALELESKRLFRRAAARWNEIMIFCMTDKERELVKRRADLCLYQAKNPTKKVEF
jgi:hypothetical protein